MSISSRDDTIQYYYVFFFERTIQYYNVEFIEIRLKIFLPKMLIGDYWVESHTLNVIYLHHNLCLSFFNIVSSRVHINYIQAQKHQSLLQSLGWNKYLLTRLWTRCSLLSYYVGMSIITIVTATYFSAVASDFVFLTLIEAIIMNLR